MLILIVVYGSAKNGNGSCVVVSVTSSSSSSGVSVKGDENSCQKFFGNVSNGSPARGRFTANGSKICIYVCICMCINIV